MNAEIDLLHVVKKNPLFKWYIYSHDKKQFMPINKEELSHDDIVCYRDDNGYVSREGANVFVVTSPVTAEEGFRMIPLVTAMGLIKHVIRETGYPIYPSEFDVYIKDNGDIDEDWWDRKWGIISNRHDCAEWCKKVESDLPTILLKPRSQ